jgi:hypothetical protein
MINTHRTWAWCGQMAVREVCPKEGDSSPLSPKVLGILKNPALFFEHTKTFKQGSNSPVS